MLHASIEIASGGSGSGGGSGSNGSVGSGVATWAMNWIAEAEQGTVEKGTVENGYL